MFKEPGNVATLGTSECRSRAIRPLQPQKSHSGRMELCLALEKAAVAAMWTANDFRGDAVYLAF